MGTSRFTSKVYEYCGQIAKKVYEGKAWAQDWEMLITSLYSKESRNPLSDALGLPSSMPPYTHQSNDIDELIKKFEDKLNSYGDDAQLANVDLQNTMQRQQVTIQTMSSVSKMMHDSAMSIIRKIG